MVDVSDFPKADVLKRTRYLRDASVDEVTKATGLELPAAPRQHPTKEKSPSARTPVSMGKTKVVSDSPPPPTSPAPLRQSRHARAKASATR
jgi:hypothetical protein